ncbi:MAG: aspartate-semialdehyde dehydrogenase [Gammaproteobacteria bacterium RIFCSPHIGHO2_12_FULL_45_12]|nr:MAG: aspartate-semialdehyde dehydrogenase [Gammaproteobacteria bacterium RIFCSPHIGHO2_12_FULL_45_12]
MSSHSIAVVGATGLVGTTVLRLLHERHFPIKKLHLIASEHSSGKVLDYDGQPHVMVDLETFDFSQVEIAFFCVSIDLASIYAEKAAQAGCVVIDKSYCFRKHPDVPLIVPEVNEAALAQFKMKRIIASPNCSTIPIAVALKPIYDAVGIQRINVATYQSVSGTGKAAMLELAEQSRQLLNHEPILPNVYPQQIAFNVLPHIDHFEDNGYTREEMKMVWELQKILNDTDLTINPTAVRVPVFCGHAAAVHLETKDKLSAEQAVSLLTNMPGIKVMTGKFPYATPARDAAGNDAVLVGRVREDISHPLGLNLWIVADNLRKGAALNAVQIAEQLIKRYFPL